jgi:hypothetical protein
MTKKPKVIVLSGKKTKDIAELAKMFKSLTGRDPTPEELERAQKRREAT